MTPPPTTTTRAWVGRDADLSAVVVVLVIDPMVALIEYNLGALCNPSPIGGVAGKVDCEVAPQLANAIVQLAGPAFMA